VSEIKQSTAELLKFKCWNFGSCPPSSIDRKLIFRHPAAFGDKQCANVLFCNAMGQCRIE